MVKNNRLNILIAPDKFKGSLTAIEACNCISNAIIQTNSETFITKLPMADGGEGSLEALETSLQFERRYLTITGPDFSKIKAFYGIKNEVAYIEMAKASGLQLLKKSAQQAMSTTTLGTGEFIVDAIDNGAKKIYLFIGGSATNDGGIGMAQALGYVFIDKNGIELKPVGSSLNNIHSIRGKSIKSFNKIEVIVVSDVKNPLTGTNGATRVYGAQKGASESEIEMLEKGMKNYASVASEHFKLNVTNTPGSGAAGGLGAGALWYLNAKIQSGIDTILDMTDFDSKLKKADVVITGEGKIDEQTLHGKVISGIMDRCVLFKKPLGVLCGINDLNEKQINALPVEKIVSIKRSSITLKESIENACDLLGKRTDELMKYLVKRC